MPSRVETLFGDKFTRIWNREELGDSRGVNDLQLQPVFRENYLVLMYGGVLTATVTSTATATVTGNLTVPAIVTTSPMVTVPEKETVTVT